MSEPRHKSELNSFYLPYHGYNSINESPLLDQESQRIVRRKFATVMFWMVIFTVTAVAIFTFAVYIAIEANSKQNPLNNYHIESHHIDRPQKWVNALSKANIIKTDGGSGTLLADGSSLWIFGDTLYKDADGTTKMISNSAMIVRVQEEEILSCEFLMDANGVPKQLIPFESDQKLSKNGIWPQGSGVLLPNGKSYFTWEVVARNYTFEENVTNGDSTFMSLRRAKVSHQTFGKGSVNKIGYSSSSHPSLHFARVRADRHPADGEQFPSFSVLSKDNKFVYMYIMRENSDQKIDVILARLTPDEMSQPDPHYAYWLGHGDMFSYDITLEEAVPVIRDWIRDNQELSIRWNAFLGVYCMLSTARTGVEMRTSDEPWGDWSYPVPLIDAAPSVLADKSLVHSAFFHPELWKGNGQTFTLTYCVEGENSEEIPYFVEVTLNEKKGAKVHVF